MPSRRELDILKSIYPVEEVAIERLASYHKLLVQWQSKTNLIAPSTLAEFWTRHVADSLQIYALKSETLQWADIGSGGGFPGLVIGILLADKDDAKISLIESIQKKCAFLRRVTTQTKAKAEILPQRIESASKQLLAADIITARALASLEKLFELTEGAIDGNCTALFHKGRDFNREIEECRGKWKFDLVIHKSKIDAESVVLEICNVGKI